VNNSFEGKKQNDMNKIRAVLLLNVNPTYEEVIAKKLLGYTEIIDVFVTFGDYDICGIVEVTDPKTLAQFVTQELRKIEGVKRTATLIEHMKHLKKP
jgi:DNA-binding Lrp family transcriptional regulator